MNNVLKKKNKSLLIIILILIAVIAYAFFNTINSFEINSVDSLKLFIMQCQNEKDGWITILVFMGALLFQIITNPITLFILGYLLINFFYKISNLKNRKHPKFNVMYFRDDLSDVSPGIASFLIDMKMDLERDIPAHILKLTLDGYIQEKDNKFIVVNRDINNLLKSDLIVLDYVASNFSNEILLSEYEKTIKNDSVKLGYTKHNSKLSMIIFFVLMPFITTIFFILTIPMYETLFVNNLIIALILLGMGLLLALITTFCFPWGILIYIFVLLKNGSYSRTKIGNVLLEQIMGLKNFLEDFSNLDESTLDHIKLREYYLIYAIVLGINTNASKDVIHNIQNQIKNSRV